MVKNFKRILSMILAICVCVGMIIPQAFAVDEVKAPAVEISLVPGETTTKSESVSESVKTGDVPENDDDKTYDYKETVTTVTRDVTAKTSKIETTVKDSGLVGDSASGLHGILPEYDENDDYTLRTDGKINDATGKDGLFDRNYLSVTQKYANPDNWEMPEGAELRYIGTGEHSKYFVGFMTVVYEQDEAGNTLYDEDGNPVIKALLDSAGNPITIDGEPATEILKPTEYDGYSGSRAQNFMLMDKNGNRVIGYCCDLQTGASTGYWYNIQNLEDSDYYASEESENHIRNIALNGYWGTSDYPEAKFGSLESFKAKVIAAVENGEIDRMVPVYKYTTEKGRYELDENGDPVVEEIVDILTIIDGLTEGEALLATQAAIWSYSNGMTNVLNGKNGSILLTPDWYRNHQPDYSKHEKEPLDAEAGARVNFLYNWLIGLNDKQESTVVINNDNFVKNTTLVIGDEVEEGVYEVDLSFDMSFAPGASDDLLVQLNYIDMNGEAVTVVKRIAGENAEGETYETLEPDANGRYTFSGIKLAENQDFRFDLRIEGKQYLEHGVYVYQAVGGREESQSFVGVAEGERNVDVSMGITVSFDVTEKVTVEEKYYFKNETEKTPPPVDKEATDLDENDQTDVTLTVPGYAEGDIDVVLILGGGMQANRKTVDSAINLFKPLMESGKSTVKIGLISLERGQEIIIDLNKDEKAVLNPDTYEQVIEDAFAYISTLPEGTTNLHSQLVEAKRMLDADTSVKAENKYVFVIATGRTYWFDDANGNQATIVNNVSDTYYWGHYLWQSQRGRHTSLYMLPDRYNDSYDAFFADVCKWVEADGDKYVYTPGFDKKDPSAYANWYANNNKDLRALGIAGSRFGLGIVNPVPTAENFVTGVPAAIGSANHPENALNYERAQYECVKVYKELVKAGYNCYAICSESPNYQNGSEYIIQGAGYTGTSTTQLGHSFMNYLARIGGQTEAPAVWDYERDADGNFVSANPVLKENFFAPIAEDILYSYSKDSTVVDYIGNNENGNFNFIDNAEYIKLSVGGVEYATAKITEAKVSATSSYAFTAPGAAEPTFWLDYYRGDEIEYNNHDSVNGDNGERFVWTFGESVDMSRPAKLTYKLQLTEKRDVDGTYIVPTNNSATLYPVDSDGNKGDPQIFPVPEVDYDVKHEEPPVTPPTISFESGKASNISFMLIDRETGEVEFLYKVDIGGETSFEIPTEEGKISAVFVKQSTSGMFWFAEEVDEDVQQAVIDCLKANNPSYKGHNAIAFGEGAHELEFKKNKFATYIFSGDIGENVVVEAPKTEAPEAEEPVEEPKVEEPAVPEVVAPEVTVKGAKVASQTFKNGISAVYVAAEGNVPAVVWVSDEVSDEELDAIIEELGADEDVKVVVGEGSHKIEYKHNKNKTKTVTYTFTIAD